MAGLKGVRAGQAGVSPPAEVKTWTWKSLAICVLAAVALSVTTTLLLGGGLRHRGAAACGGWAMATCPEQGAGKAR